MFACAQSIGVWTTKMVKVDDWTTEWTEGGQKNYFLPNVEYARNLNYEAAQPENIGKAGFGLNLGQWLIIFTLLYLNGNMATTKKMLEVHGPVCHT